MSITKFSSEEFVSLMEAKVKNGIISLKDIKKIVSDDRFPKTLTKNAIDKLKEYSEAYRRFEYFNNSYIEELEKTIESTTQFMEKTTQDLDILERKTRDIVGKRKLGFITNKKKIAKLNRDVNRMVRVKERMKADYDQLHLIFNKFKEE